MRSSSFSGARRWLPQSALLFLGVLLSGCGPNFDPPDQLHSLRILGVQKDKPYAKPGETVSLQMLWEDASPKANGRAVQIVWTPPCFDPKGDLYYACFSDPAIFGGKFGSGDSTSFQMPADIISRRPPPTESRNTAYGVAYVFFAACAGTLTPDLSVGAGALPVACLDAKGQPLGSDDFVAGYTAVYSYQDFSNNNPVISGFEFNGVELESSLVCTDSGCQPIAEAPPPDPASTDPLTSIACDATPPDPRCVSTCADDGKSSCHGYAIRPLVDKTNPLNQDVDTVSAKQLGHATGEQMWIDYYTDGGGFKSPVRLLNDATAGWNDDYGTEFYAPKDAKISRIWALVHDNRGGVAWAGIFVKSH